MRTRLLIFAAALIAAVAAPSAQSPSAKATGDGSDLDAFMSQVLARRDDNWKKLQQYILDEDERFQFTGPDGKRLYGSHREYTWFPREGVFIRSPLKVDGVAIGEADRRKAEATWVETERRRDERERKRREGPTKDGDQDEDAKVSVSIGAGGVEVRRGDEVVADQNNTATPRFVSTAYFMRFKFDPGHYALVGREKLLNRDALKIEYYPTRLFQEGPTRENKKLREKDDQINQKMNKVALVTLWVEPNDHQILQYEFRNIDFDFLPGRSLVRLDQLRAAMRMGEAFPGVWLPDTITMRFGMTLAIGSIAAEYDVRYHDYRLAEVKTRMQ